MASRVHAKVVGSILAYFTLSLAGGCVPPFPADPWWVFSDWTQEILFETEWLSVHYKRVKLLDERLELFVLPTSPWMEREDTTYGINLYVKATYPELRSEIQFEPESVTVSFNDIRMSGGTVRKAQYRKSDSEYEVEIEFTCRECLPLWRNRPDTWYARDTITFDLSKFVRFKDEYVPVEPLVGFDWRKPESDPEAR